MRNVFPYFDAEYSYAYYKIEDFTTDMQTILAFSSTQDTLLMASNLGSFEKIELNQKGGKCKLLEKRTDLWGFGVGVMYDGMVCQMHCINEK